jgi:thiol-disulfide isomerase/thioredoxin
VFGFINLFSETFKHHASYQLLTIYLLDCSLNTVMSTQSASFYLKSKQIYFEFYVNRNVFDRIKQLSSLECKEEIEFVAGCGHCKAMKSDYAQAAEKVRGDSSNSWLATVDATAQPALQKKFNIRGFPTLKLFRSGREVKDYDQGRNIADIVAFMKSAGVKDEL